MKFKEFDVVELARDIPAHGVSAGMTATILDIYHEPPGYEIEVINSASKTLFVGGISEEDLVPLSETAGNSQALHQAAMPSAMSTSPSVSQSRYWDYPFERCMVRETRTAEGLDIGIKFYGKAEWLVDHTHEIYCQVLRTGLAPVEAEAYERGKEDPPKKFYEHRSSIDKGKDGRTTT